jgi:deoxyribonuclease-4
MEQQIKLGSHVGMSGKDMFLGSVKEAVSYGANTFMIYTGAPQNTRRKKIEELNIETGWKMMREHGIEEFIVHAPYIINLANTVKPEVFQLAVEFLQLELDRTQALKSKVLVLHPGSHVGAGVDAGIDQIAKGLNEVLTPETNVYVALETMAGKGSEIGRNFEELARIYDKVVYSDKLRVCFDTCHVSDAGYDIIHDYEGVIDQFDRLIGKNQIAAFHINDSKNPPGAGKDRHENAGFGTIGFEALKRVVYDPQFEAIPKILESPYVPGNEEKVKTYPPYKYEIAMYRQGIFDEKLKEKIVASKGK